MAAFVRCLFLTAGLTVGFSQFTLAQTARIAHLSHSGSLERLDAAVDNFGDIRIPFVVDSIRLTSDSTTLEYGKWRDDNPERIRSTRLVFKATTKDKREMVQYYHEHHPKVKLIGFDTTDVPAKMVLPVRRKHADKRKKSDSPINVSAAPPQHPGVLLAVVLIVGLGSLGWLLGEWPRPAATSAA
jgi:hypothetical protein